jgi:hypothetical protein
LPLLDSLGSAREYLDINIESDANI